MKALLKHLALGLLLLVPFSPARAQAAPLLSPIANMSLNAGSTRSIDVVAVDPDGGPISITAALPPFATLNAPTVGNGSRGRRASHSIRPPPRWATTRRR